MEQKLDDTPLEALLAIDNAQISKMSDAELSTYVKKARDAIRVEQEFDKLLTGKTRKTAKKRGGSAKEKKIMESISEEDLFG
jgi:hypothetical protein